MSQPRSIFGPLFLIAAGVVWLLVQADQIPVSNLWALTHIWPYLLIVAGVGLMLRPYWKYTSILLDVIAIGGVFLAIYFAPVMAWDNPSLITWVGDNEFYVGPGEPGSGEVITQNREVADFTAIEVDYPAQITVRQGDSVSVTIEAEDNLLSGLQTRVRDNTLRVFYKVEDGRRVYPTRAVKLTIVVKDLSEVHFESAGELTIEGVVTEKLSISLSGAGDLHLNDVTAKEIIVHLSGAGSMTASGTADEFTLNISGFGSFDGKELHNQTADIDLSGAGSATVWVDDELDAQISGAGSINYYDSPEVTKHISGVGSVSKSGDK